MYTVTEGHAEVAGGETDKKEVYFSKHGSYHSFGDYIKRIQTISALSNHNS